ncbi:hypothetical protein ACFPFV_08395 [Salinicoccus siamensis]|uniref:DUF4129 domain-containing protein n=1 Tax=Salinicoccus siamensis TaxID=381830 RepID=A0ABV5Z291_9STAP
MNRLKYAFRLAHIYFIDMFPLLFVIVLINIHNGKAPFVLPFVAITVAALAVSFLIAGRIDMNRLYFMLPVLFVAAFLFGFNWLAALLTAYVPILRLEYLHDGSDNDPSPAALITTFLLLIGTHLIGTSEALAHTQLFHGIFLTLLLFFFIGRLVIHLIGNGYAAKRNISILLMAAGTFVVLGGVFSLIYNYAAFAMKYLVVLLLNGMIFLLRPLFNALEEVELEMPKMESEEESAEEGESVQEQLDQGASFNHVPFDTIMMILLAAVIIVGLYIYYKKREQPTVEDSSAHTSANASVSHSALPIQDKMKAPDDRVRKVYFNFEKWLASKGMGRYRNETIEEWIDRLKLDTLIDQEQLDTYMETRYRSQDATPQDYKAYKDNIRMMKKAINNHVRGRTVD